ncbi:MAG: hypothetical protein HQ582_08705 [Planctomycetes bacterium]|nr:hypothetical protein [Planctomycetota bacterium]
MNIRKPDSTDGRDAMSRRDFLARTAGGAAGAGLASGRWGAAEEKGKATTGPSGPLAMWALTGTLKSDDVVRQLDAFGGAGWGVVLYPRWGSQLEYLGDAWFERIRFVVEEAAAREMEVWLYDEFCWPSGHAKGLVTKDREDLTAELLEIQPDGRTSLERVPESANLLMPEATERFIEVTHERYAKAIGEFLGGCVRAIFTDEPSLSMQHRPKARGAVAWQLPWSSAMDRALGGDFRERLGGAGDLSRWSGWRDYWAAYSQVFHDAWVAPLARWCREHRIALTGHLLGEGSFGSQVAYNGSLRRQLGEFGIPGIDEIRTRTNPSQCEALTLAAIAEYPGRERMVEAYALGPPSMKLDTMRKMVDLCSACGVDRYVMAICPHDLRGGVYKREYLGIHGPQQPWFDDYAKVYADYVAEAAKTARKAEPLGVAWPSDEELWAAAGPDPRRSKELAAITGKVVAEAREAITARIAKPVAVAPAILEREPESIVWSFEPRGLNSIRLDQSTLAVVDVPSRAELSVQCQLVRGLRVNGVAVDLGAAPVDHDFDLSYRRVSVAAMLKTGENDITVDLTEPKPLEFLPALVLWGDFAVDAQGRLVKQPKTIRPGDWRKQGYPAFCGTGRYRAVVEFDTPPTRLTVETGGYPARVTVNGKHVGSRAWPPLGFELHGAAQPGRNEIVVEVVGTLGHLFVPSESPPVGLLEARFES